MKILVSGATGFVGGAITRHLLAGGHEVRAMSRSPEGARRKLGSYDEGRQGFEEHKLTIVGADVTEPATLPPAVRDVDVIVQAAQFPGAPVEDADKGLTYMNVDRNGTLNLLQAVNTVYRAETAGPGLTRFPEGAPRLIYISGVTVSENPTTTWDRAKWQAEEAIRSSGLEWSILRNSPAYGAEDKAFNRIIGYSDFQPFVPLFGDGEAPMTPSWVEDVGRIVLRLVEDREAARDLTLPFGGPNTVTINDMMRTMLELMGRKRWLLHVPKPIGKAQGFLLQFLPGQILSPAAVDFVSMPAVADLTLLRERFPDFEPTPLRQGLRTYLVPSSD